MYLVVYWFFKCLFLFIQIFNYHPNHPLKVTEMVFKNNILALLWNKKRNSAKFNVFSRVFIFSHFMPYLQYRYVFCNSRLVALRRVGIVWGISHQIKANVCKTICSLTNSINVKCFLTVSPPPTCHTSAPTIKWLYNRVVTSIMQNVVLNPTGSHTG